jgi:HEAT repeat protein
MTTSDATINALRDRIGAADGNPDDAAAALGELVTAGHPAVPALVSLGRSDSAEVRVLAAEGLGTIADPESLPEVKRLLEDQDGRVRSLAAVALHRLGDPGAVDALVATLDDWPDLLHAEMSRSAYELAAVGPEALPTVLPLLDSPTWVERARAVGIVRAIVTDHPDDPRLADLGTALSDFDPGGSDEQRAAVLRGVPGGPSDPPSGHD